MKNHVEKAEKIALCRMCHGTGTVDGKECPQCHGSGRVIVKCTMDVDIKPYIDRNGM